MSRRELAKLCLFGHSIHPCQTWCFFKQFTVLHLLIEFSLAGAASIACGSGTESSTTCSAGGLAWEDRECNGRIWKIRKVRRQEDSSQLTATGTVLARVLARVLERVKWILMECVTMCHGVTFALRTSKDRGSRGM